MCIVYNMFMIYKIIFNMDYDFIIASCDWVFFVKYFIQLYENHTLEDGV